MPRRLMTERDHSILLALRDLAQSLNEQIDAISDAVGTLVNMRGDDDAITDFICNGGDIDEFLKDANLRVAKNGVETTEEPTE